MHRGEGGTVVVPPGAEPSAYRIDQNIIFPTVTYQLMLRGNVRNGSIFIFESRPASAA